MATLDEVAGDGYVSAEDEDFVPDPNDPDETPQAAVAVPARAGLTPSELVKQRDRKSRIANMFADMKGSSSSSSAGSIQDTGAGAGAGAGAASTAASTTATATATATAKPTAPSSSSNGTKPVSKLEQARARMRAKRSAPDILQRLNRANRRQNTSTQARQVLSNILGRAPKRQRVAPAASSAELARRSKPRIAGQRAGSNRVLVTEQVKFAGKTMSVTKSITLDAAAKAKANAAAAAAASSAAASTSQSQSQSGGGAGAGGARRAAGTGLDAVVAMLDDPKKINTVEKSSMDWETYKLKHGIEDDVEQGAKDGYVTKQEFLQRVDVRRFEIEREERARKRVTAAAAAAKAKR